MDFDFFYVTFFSGLLILSIYLFIKLPETRGLKNTRSFYGYMSIASLILWLSELIDFFNWPFHPISDIIFSIVFLAIVILHSFKILRKYDSNRGFKSISDEAYIAFLCSLGTLLTATT